MDYFNIYDVKKRLKEIRILKGISKLSLEKNQILSRRQIQRIESLDQKDFLSLPKLMDLAYYYGVSIDYLLGISNFMDIKQKDSYKDLFRLFIKIIELRLVEFEITSSSTSFFILKGNDSRFVEFFSEYKKILSLKPSIDDSAYEIVLNSLVSRFDDDLK